ncbi:Na(+)/H(+) exchanger beta-like [Mizuhopecten yessoensis]|uniref:Sodium/hydrogen exchanger n=1 Tax=Mizuhopecten yessoensis TaxID=6573 RepID=A0A210R2D3_MIZYE|nr:Na(+)/H(+) exchanger beta-like [Mizuhopecten yessoensis]OWF55240.1 Sodium/hydrogen exchanger 3 [Mizuhopecten yessoensis]
MDGRTRWLSLLAISCAFVYWVPVNAHVSEGQESNNETERYQLVVFDFARVELPYVICLWILIVSLARIAFHLHHKLPTVIPESCLLIVLGLIVGAILHYSHVATTSDYVLDANIFFIYLLPPIIFEAGYFMPVRSFFDNLGTILLMAVVNTCISSGLIGVSLYGLSCWGLFGRNISLLSCFIFSSLISAVDPVAVLSIFEEVHVNQMLYIIVFGESLLNDGVTVVLYHMMEGFIEIGEDKLIAIDVATGLSSFFVIALGGTLIGILFGLFGGFITKYTQHVTVIEPLFVFVLGYLMYLTSEMCHLSGILALSFGGIVLRHYLEANISRKTKTSIKYFMKMLANISETIIFMFLGLSTMVDTLDWNLSFILFALLFCLLYRALGVIILSFILNRRRLVKLTGIDQFIMAYGGLRGGIAFCLSLSLKEELVPEKRLFITATIIIVFFTVFVQGITIKPVVNALKVKKEKEGDPSLHEKINETFIDHLMAGIEGVTKRSGHNLMRSKFRHINHKYIKPWLNRESVKLTTTKADKVLDIFHSISVQDALHQMGDGEAVEVVGGHKLPLLSAESRMNGYHQDNAKNGRIVPSLNTEKDAHLHRLLNEGMLRTRTTCVVHQKNSVLEAEEHKRHVRPAKLFTVVSGSHHSVSPHNSHSNRHTEHTSFSPEVTDDVFDRDSDEHDNVTLNFKPDTEDLKEPISEPLPPTTTATELELPWKRLLSQEPIPSMSSRVSSCEEPLHAEAPSWVNNLSYNHLLASGSPYASPEVTFVPVIKETKVSIYTVFPPAPSNEGGLMPPPWSTHSECSQEGDAPLTSINTCHPGDKSNNYLLSNHMSPPPSHHIIIPTIQHLDGSVSRGQISEEGEHKPLRSLPGSASAPDLPKHWTHFNPKGRLHSESVLEEAKLQEQLQSRVQEWLYTTNDNNDGIIIDLVSQGTPDNLSDNDADDESDDREDDNELESSHL